MPADVLAFFRGLGLDLIEVYGMTENSGVSHSTLPGSRQTGSVGLPYAGVESRIDPETGEIQMRCPALMTGYYREEAQTAAAFTADGWLRTGDVGHIDPQGFVTLTDRAKDVIKSGGEWISSVELENELIAHPAVLEAAVVGVPDDRWQERPLAAVVLKSGGTATPDELREFLSDKVARWWLPERWVFIDQVPRTSVGKYDKKTIRSRHAENAYEVVTL